MQEARGAWGTPPPGGAVVLAPDHLASGPFPGRASRAAARKRGPKVHHPIRGRSGARAGARAQAVPGAPSGRKAWSRSKKKSPSFRGTSSTRSPGAAHEDGTGRRPGLGVAPTCADRRCPGRRTTGAESQARTAPPTIPRALPPEERQAVLDVLHEPRFVDLAPAEVYATLLDEGNHLCSERTMYRILAENREVRERRNQLRHPAYEAPSSWRRAREVWSWDITKLLGPAKWTYYYLYVMLDIFSRYVVGWMLADREWRCLPGASSGRPARGRGSSRASSRSTATEARP